MLCGQSIKNRSCVITTFSWLVFSSPTLISTVNAAVLGVEAVDTASSGELVTFNISVTNDSNNAIELAILTAQLISAANVASIQADQGTCSLASASCDLGTIEANEKAEVTVDVYPQLAEGVFQQDFTSIFDLQGFQRDSLNDEKNINVKQTSTVVVTAIATSITAGINIKEGEVGDARFIVKLNAPAASNGMTINFEVSGSATEGGDYSDLGRSITIPAGQTEAVILFQVVDDSEKEENETVIVNLQAGDTYQRLEPQMATFTIEDNDASDAVGFQQGEYQFEENSGQVTIPVDRIGNADQAVSVAFSIEAGTVSVGDDVVFSNGILNWAAGELGPKNINFTLQNDDLDEGDESFRILLSNPEGTVINADKTTIVIKGRARPRSTDSIPQFDKISGAELRTLHLNAKQNLSIKLRDGGGQVLVNRAVVWSLNEEAIDRGGRFFTENTDIDTTSDDVTVMTDDQGIASIKLKTGGAPGSYEVTATLSDDESAPKTVFKLAVGLENIAPAGTPAAALAKTVDTVCPQLKGNEEKLNANEKDLLNLCTEIVVASGNNQDSEANKALSEMSPEEVAVTRLISQNVTLQQLGNITSRLAALRSGVRGVSMNQLSFRLNGKYIPSQLYSYLLPASALAASDGLSASEPDGGLLDNRLGVFVNGSINAGEKSETDREDGFKFDNYGLTFGADYRVKPDVVIGGALGVSRSGVDISSDGGELEANGFSLAVYGTYYYSEKIYIDGIISAGRNDYEMSRGIKYKYKYQYERRLPDGNIEIVDVNVDVNRTADSQTDSNQKGLSFGAGYEFFRDKNQSANLFGRLEYVTYKIDAFSETGAQGLDVNINSQSANSLISSIGGQAQSVQTLSWGVVLPLVWLSWEHEYKANDNKIEGSFVNDPNQNQFSFATDAPDRNFFSAGAGASFVLPFGLSAYARYEVLLAKRNYTDRTLSFGARYELNF